MKVLREYLEDQVLLSELVERYGIHVNDLYNCKKKLFGGTAQAVSKKQVYKVRVENRKMEEPEGESI